MALLHHPSLGLAAPDDTRPGVYFVTLCAHEHQWLFGRVSHGMMRLNAWGRIVWDEWQRTELVRTDVVLDTFGVMPNHVHGVLVIRAPDRGNGEPMGIDPTVSEPAPFQSPLRTLGAIVREFKSTTTAQINAQRGTPGEPVWQGKDWERTIRTDREWHHVRRYIAEHPLRWYRDQ